MAIGSSIQNFTQASSSGTSSSFSSETSVLSKISEMRAAMAHENNDLELELLAQRHQKELQYTQSIYNAAVKAEDKKQKAIKAWEEKQKKAKKKATEEEEKAFLESLDKRYEKELKLAEKVADAKKRREDRDRKAASAKSALTDKGLTVAERTSLLKDAGLSGLIAGLSDIAKQLDKTIDDIGKYQGKLDTRLLGSGKTFEGWNGISRTITGVAGASPFVTQAQVMSKVDELVSKGIAYNVEQRAFLGTISDKIATTFDAANGTLLKLVRVQQADTTAARLGMENYLNTYLNSMYMTTEYLSDVSANVKSALYEATAQMSAASGVGFEFQVQKWLGSLYSVGMSSEAIQAIAQGLGYLGSGNVSALNGNSSLQNLLVMSASRAGLSYADLLSKGLDESKTNQLMEAMVEYLQQIANSNKVVQSQYAAVFGMSMSDISAAKNLTGDLSKIYKTNMNYGGAMNNLFSAANSMYSRTSMGEMLSNLWENTMYNMSAGIAANPVLYAIYKVANLLDATVGGIQIPAFSVMGNMVDLETSVADLMRVGALSGGMLSSLAAIISGGGGGIIPSLALKSLGLDASKVSVISRGTGLTSPTGGATVSQNAYIGNASSSDIQDTTVGGARDDANQQYAEAKEEDSSTTLDIVDGHVVDIYNLLDSLVVGNALRVSVDNYGLSGISAFN